MICVYEDEGFKRLSPLVDLRPVFDLRCGRRTLLEKLRRLYPKEEFHLWVRDELAELVAEAHPDCHVNRPVRNGRLFISGRAILNEPVSSKGREAVLLAGDEVVGFRLGKTRFSARTKVRLGTRSQLPAFYAGLRLWPGFRLGTRSELSDNSVMSPPVMSHAGLLEADLAQEQVKAKVVRRPWDIVELNAGELERESCRRNQKSETRNQKSETKALPNGAVVVGLRSSLMVARGARVWPGAVISTETGPVMIDRDAQVRPGSFVEGPCYVGPGTVIDGARVRPGCSFGPECRIGGEVEASVFQGFSNKHHDGFVGHSYVGEWTNLGALTTNSDLKNAYQPVQVFYDGKPVDTGLLKVGCFIGDHVKTAIGSLFNTGARVGTFANWFEPGLSPKEIPAFSWGRDARWKLADVLTCARQVMARRGVEMTPVYERAFRRLWAASRQP